MRTGDWGLGLGNPWSLLYVRMGVPYDGLWTTCNGASWVGGGKTSDMRRNGWNPISADVTCSWQQIGYVNDLHTLRFAT